MKTLMKVKKPKKVCQNRSIWKVIVSAYVNRKQAFFLILTCKQVLFFLYTSIFNIDDIYTYATIPWNYYIQKQKTKRNLSSFFIEEKNWNQVIFATHSSCSSFHNSTVSPVLCTSSDRACQSILNARLPCKLTDLCRSFFRSIFKQILNLFALTRFQPRGRATREILYCFFSYVNKVQNIYIYTNK